MICWNMNSVLISLTISKWSIFSCTIFLVLTMLNEKLEPARMYDMNLYQQSIYSWKSWQVRSSFFSGWLSRVLRNITDELFVFVLDSSALQWRVTTKEEKRFTLAINNNESTRSMCLVTDIPHFPLFIFLASLPFPPALVCIQPETRGNGCWT